MSLLLFTSPEDGSAPEVRQSGWVTMGTIMVSAKAIKVYHYVEVQTSGTQSRERHAFVKGSPTTTPKFSAWSAWAETKVVP